jgi:hypothetical protein
MIRFDNRDDFVEIDLARKEDACLPSLGDGMFTIQVPSSGFTGHTNAWVSADSLRSFCTALVRLEQKRKGEARLEAIMPEELSLAIRSTDSRGHMAVEGVAGGFVFREDSQPWNAWHAVQFGFEFGPSQLATAVREEWIQENAE